MDYITEWAKDFKARVSLELRKPVEVEGVCNVHLGPRWEFAKILLRAEPADEFCFDVNLGDKKRRFEDEGYIDSLIKGLLDSLLVSETAPLRKVRVTLISAEDHEIDSSTVAFRLAGRAAGRKILDASIHQMLGKSKSLHNSSVK